MSDTGPLCKTYEWNLIPLKLNDSVDFWTGAFIQEEDSIYSLSRRVVGKVVEIKDTCVILDSKISLGWTTQMVDTTPRLG